MLHKHRVGIGTLKKEDGFTMVLVLTALVMLSILGAASMLLMVSTLTSTINNKPENRAFHIAKTGLNVAHTKIVSHEVPAEGYTLSGEIMGGTYTVNILPLGGYDYSVVSSGEYQDTDGTFYRRKIEEKASYSAERGYDALRNYILFARNTVTIDINSDIPNAIPVTFNGNIRGENGVYVNVTPNVGMVDGLTFNGSVEGKRFVNILCAPVGTGNKTAVVNVYGPIKTGDVDNPSITGHINLAAAGEGNAKGIINAGVGGAAFTWDLYYNSITETAPGDNIIRTGNKINHAGVTMVHTPEPDFEYYKILAMDQGTYNPGNMVLEGNLGDLGTSSVTVFYCGGDMTLNNINWNEPDLHGIFVCEGNFTTNTTSTLKFKHRSLFQVVAGGDVIFKNKWQFPKGGSNSEFFIWSGRDVYVELAMFAEQILQVTALRDIMVKATKSPQAPGVQCTVNYRTPDIDVGAWPIDIKVWDWRELPSQP